jgi:Restriction alleviation protein Lar
MSMSELKLCPFCGGKAHFFTAFYKQHPSPICVGCSNMDGCQINPNSSYYASEKEAAAAWNTRPESKNE